MQQKEENFRGMTVLLNQLEKEGNTRKEKFQKVNYDTIEIIKIEILELQGKKGR